MTDLELTCMASALRSGAALREQGRLFMNLHAAVLGAGERVREALMSEAARRILRYDEALNGTWLEEGVRWQLGRVQLVAATHIKSAVQREHW